MAKIEDVNLKLEYLDDTKSLIKQAIINKGQEIEETATFREYVDKISNIRTKSNFIPGELSTNRTTLHIGDTITMPYSPQVADLYKIGDYKFIEFLHNKLIDVDVESGYRYKLGIIEIVSIEPTSETNTNVTFMIIAIFDEPFPEFIAGTLQEKGIIYGNEITGQNYNWYSYAYSNLDLTNADVLQGKQFIGASGIETGNMSNNGQLNYSPMETAQIIPEGYTSGGTISAMDITITSDYGNCLTLSKNILGIE